jgi:hypothetical protein
VIAAARRGLGGHDRGHGHAAATAATAAALLLLPRLCRVRYVHLVRADVPRHCCDGKQRRRTGSDGWMARSGISAV